MATIFVFLRTREPYTHPGAMTVVERLLLADFDVDNAFARYEREGKVGPVGQQIIVLAEAESVVRMRA